MLSQRERVSYPSNARFPRIAREEPSFLCISLSYHEFKLHLKGNPNPDPEIEWGRMLQVEREG